MPRLLEMLDALQPMNRRTRVVAIDGCGGSGKSTLANELASRRPGVAIVRMDDFYRPELAGWDWQRLRQQVLEPLAADRPARYQRHDWSSERLAEWHDVPVGGIVIVEGVSSMRTELGKYWDLAIWVACSRERRLERGLARDGDAARERWLEIWMPAEDEYVRIQQPEQRADLIVDGEAPFPL